MAEETVDAAIKEYNLKPTGPSQTDHIKLLGAHAWTKTMYIKLTQQFGHETEVAQHLAESYGDQAWTVASMSDPTGMSLSNFFVCLLTSRTIMAIARNSTYPAIPLH
jgi:glycerol-3-phosphate dehydrogenase